MSTAVIDWDALAGRYPMFREALARANREAERLNRAVKALERAEARYGEAHAAVLRLAQELGG